MSTDPIRVWLDVFDDMDPPPGRADAEDGERMRAALRAVLDLCDEVDQYAIRSRQLITDIRTAIADALGVIE